jgi:hypothetical protein
MKTFVRIFLCFLITWCLVAQLYILAIPLVIWYLSQYRSYELIVIAILVDGYYQAFYSVPILSIVAVISVILVDIIKPQLLMYTGNNEVVS